MKKNEFPQPITETIEKNFMPYAMSVIMSRAIPEIDGFKPSHRKLLFTMYKMGLLNGAKTKSANVVGQTMKLNPHGDSAIYETLVRLARGNESLLYPLVDSKGNFGKVYSRDMAYAAARYTECKLDSICAEVFKEIEKDTVDFMPNYDNTMDEPVLLPVAFPNILVNPNQGIAVGMASNICSFNLSEVCDTAIELIKNPNHNVIETLIAPDFSTGGYIVLSQDEMNAIYESGRGSFKVRSKYSYDKKEKCIEIREIPYTTTIEAIIDKIVELVKGGKIREISDVRDESDIDGLKIAIDIKSGTEPEALMAKLYKQTPLEDSFACNFNLLIAGVPRVCGVREIFEEWTAFRTECIRRRVVFDINKKKERLHLLKGLKAILLDIDKAIAIIKNTEDEKEVVPNLMIGFGIDEIQGEYIAEIKLRALNRENVLKKIAEIDSLIAEIEDLTDLRDNQKRLKKYIIDELSAVKKKYGAPRKSDIIYSDEITVYEPTEHIEDYPVTAFITKQGYFKKITPLSLRGNSEQKLKEDDAVISEIECTNKSEILVFTDKQQCYKAKLYDFEDTKASLLGDFLGTKLSFEQGENFVGAVITTDYKGFVLFFYEDGKCAKVDIESYATKQNRKKLTSAFSGKSPLVAIKYITEEREFVLTSTNGKILIASSAMMNAKTTRSTAGVAVMTQRAKNKLYSVALFEENDFANPNKYRTKNIPAAGSALSEDDKILQDEQLSLI